jgi:EmrB/QacA subfamily drug resistance transporter
MVEPAARGGPAALAALALAMLLASLGTSIANIALPTLAQAFGASFQHIQWVVLAYLLAITVFIVSAGRLGDLFGRRRLMLAGIVLFAAGALGCAAAPTLGLLIAARALQGLGAALMMSLTLALVGETVPRDRTGSAMGLLATMSAVGTALGPSLGGWLIAHYGWPAIFLLNLPLCLLAFALAWFTLPATRPEGKRVRFDSLGTAVLAFALACYALAMTLGRGRPGPLNAGLLLLAVAGAWLFVRVQASSPSPLLHLTLLREPQFASSFAMSALVATVVMATLVVGPFYLSRALGLDPARVGLLMSSGPVAAALIGWPAGRLVDRFGAARTTQGGLYAMGTGALGLTLLPAPLGEAGYVLPLVLLTAGYGLFQAANNTGVMAAVAPARRGVVSAVLTLSRNLGLISGAALMAALFALGSGAPLEQAAPAAVARGMRLTYAAATLLLLGAFAMARGAEAAARLPKKENCHECR